MNVTEPVPLERYFHAADALRVLASARKLALLDVLERAAGSLTLAGAIFQGGLPTHGALRDAAELETLGLVVVERPTGRNLSEILTITPEGSRFLAVVRSWAD